MSSDKDTIKKELDSELKAPEPTTINSPTPVANAPAPEEKAKKEEKKDQAPPSHKVADFFERSEEEKKNKAENPLMDAMNALRDWVIAMQKENGPEQLIEKAKSILNKLTNFISKKADTPQSTPDQPDVPAPAAEPESAADLNPDNTLNDIKNELSDWVKEVEQANVSEKFIQQAQTILSKVTDVASKNDAIPEVAPEQPKIDTTAKVDAEPELAAMDDTINLGNDKIDVEMQEIRKQPAPQVPNDPDLEIDPKSPKA